MPPSNATQPPQALVWWVLWGSFQIGIVFIHQFVGGARATVPVIEPAPWQFGLLPVLISGALRWSMLPAFKNAVKALPVFIVGIALAEVTCFLGIFIFPSHQFLLFIASVLGIFQFIPVYYRSYFESNRED